MIQIDKFFQPLMEHGYNYYTGVPCSFFKSAINYAIANPDTEFTMAANEGAAMAMAAGAWLGGKKTVVMMQNSGFGNTVSPLTSLNAIYDIPAMVLVSGRAFGVDDEPQHEIMGRRMTDMMDSMELKWEIIPDNEEEWPDALAEAEAYTQEHNRPFIWIAKKGCLSSYPSDEDYNSYPMGRFEVIQKVAAYIKDNFPEAAVFSTTGMISRELYEALDRPEHFYMMGSMGHAAALGLGFAQAQPEKKVFVIDGDGALLMHTGTMSVVGNYAPDNFYHICIDNHAHESTGNQKTTSETTDFCEWADASGYTNSLSTAEPGQLGEALEELTSEPGPSFLRIFVNSQPKKGTPRITESHTAPEITANFLPAIIRNNSVAKPTLHSPPYHGPVATYWGEGTRFQIPELAARVGATKVMLICRIEILDKSGFIAPLISDFIRKGMEVYRSNAITIEPALTDIKNLFEELITFKPDLVIAIGGGSTMDSTKAAVLLAEAALSGGWQPNWAADGSGLPSAYGKRATKLWCMPTTSGTGSEVTPYASLALSTGQSKKKMSISSPEAVPDVAVLDPELTYSCPAGLRASSGFDALAQGIESFWSANANLYSRPFSLNAVQAVYSGLGRLVKNADDKEALASVMLGAHYSGLAIAVTQTTSVHAASYPLSTLFGVPHGQACAFTLAGFMDYNRSFFEEYGHPLLNALQAVNVDEAIDNVVRLQTDTGLQTRLGAYSITAEDIPAILDLGFRPDRAGNNPVPYGRADLEKILASIL